MSFPRALFSIVASTVGVSGADDRAGLRVHTDFEGGSARVEEVDQAAKYHPLWRQISNAWVSQHGNSHTVAVCLETSWNTPYSTTEGYRTVGRQLGQTVADYLRRE